MTERFKKYLEMKFRAISPTKAAAEYRKEILKQLLEYAQDLKIKGMEDEDVIFQLCIESLGDFDKKLSDFESGFEEEKKAKNLKAYILGGVCGYAGLLMFAYILMGALNPDLWHPGWLLPVCGLLFAGALGGVAIAVICFLKKKNLLARLGVALGVVLVSVGLFLLVNILTTELIGDNKVKLTWYIFLVMVCVLLIGDSVIAILTKNKFAFWETLVSVLVTVVLLYVMIGIPTSFWHPGWLMILGAVVGDAVAIGVHILLKRNKKMKELRKLRQDRRSGVDEKYYTEW